MRGVIDVNPLALLPFVACFTAALSGALLSTCWAGKKKAQEQQKKIRQRYLGFDTQDASGSQAADKGMPAKIISFMQTQSNLIRLKPQGFYLVEGPWSMATSKFKEICVRATLDTSISLQGFCHARALLCIGLTLICAVLGVVFSMEAMLVGTLIGAIIGWKMPAWSLTKRIEQRRRSLEDHLSEMLEVISLGLRSGLSFDQSFELYHSHFRTSLAAEAASVQRQWQLGLNSRENALRGFAQSYDSMLFSRVIENIIRSLRFGASLVDSFDSAALEARLMHKAHREEEVAKAPVKMLIPTATLILPAMLLLVLGPILLDMMQGF